MKWEEIVNFCPGFVSPTTVRAREGCGTISHSKYQMGCACTHSSDK